MPVELNVQDAVALLTINNPPANSLSTSLLAELEKAADLAMSDGAVRVIVVTGAGGGFFAAGADLRELARFDAESGAAAVQKAKRALGILSQGPKPVVAAINGMAAGGGLELALACDLRICSDQAQLGLPEVKLGVMPGAGGTQILPRVIGPAAAAWLMMSGELISAGQALDLGLVNQVVKQEQVLPIAMEMAARLAAGAPLALAQIKAALADAWSLPLSEGMKKETQRFARLCQTQDKREGVKAFLGKRSANFQGN